MSKGKINPSIESMEESGERAASITPRMAIQCARASLLLSSLRPSTLRRSSGAYADPGTEEIVKFRRQVVDLSAEICSQRQQTKRSLHLKNLEAVLGFKNLRASIKKKAEMTDIV